MLAAQDGYFTQPSREAASALRHRWVAAMALVAVHALLIVSLLLVHAAVKATSAPAVSSGVAGLGQELLDMPQRIEDVLEAAVEDAEDNEPGLTAEQRQARDRDKAATGPAAAAPAAAAAAEAEPVDTGVGDLQREPGASGAAASAAGTQAGAADGAQGLAQGGQQPKEVAAERGQGRRLLGASLGPQVPVDSRSVDEAWLVASQGTSGPSAAVAAPCADDPVRAVVLQQRLPSGIAAAPALASLSLRSFAGDLGALKDASAAAAAPAGGAASPAGGLGSAEDGGRAMRLYATTPVDAAAVCNDGSPGAFYRRPGIGDGADKCAAALSSAGQFQWPVCFGWSRCMRCGCSGPHRLLWHRASLGCCLWLMTAELPGVCESLHPEPQTDLIAAQMCAQVGDRRNGAGPRARARRAREPLKPYKHTNLLPWCAQVGDPLPGRRMVLGRALVRDALGEHAVPDVHACAAAGHQRHSACGRPARRGPAGARMPCF